MKDEVGANNEDEVMAWGDVGDDSPSAGERVQQRQRHGTTADGERIHDWRRGQRDSL